MCLVAQSYLTLCDSMDCSLLGSSEGEGEVTQLCPTLCDPVDCGLPGFSIHGILPARILEWVTISFSRSKSKAKVFPKAKIEARLLFALSTIFLVLGARKDGNLSSCVLEQQLHNIFFPCDVGQQIGRGGKIVLVILGKYRTSLATGHL